MHLRVILISKAQAEHALMRDDTVLPATHTSIHTWNVPSCRYSPAAEHHCTLAGTHFPSH